jgi:hypothetical protein
MELLPMSIKDAIKRAAFPQGKTTVRIKAGAFRGLKLSLQPQSNMQFIFGLYERETQPIIRSMLGQGAWLIDVGAGLGELCILFARHGIPAVAVEPKPDEWDTVQNMRLNGLQLGDLLTLETRLVGLGNADQFVALDEIAQGRQGRGFIKIDVDGAEIEVLRSADKILRRKSATFLIETHSAKLEQECIALMRSAGYNTSIIDNAWWRVVLPELRPHDVNRWLHAAPCD